jgi:branched-chain amino acid transport system permease protein
VGEVTPFDDYGLLAVLLPNVRIVSELFYLALFAISFDFISGYTGYLSFGHSMFFGSGMFLVLGARIGDIPLIGPETSFVTLIVLAMVFTFLLTLLIGSVSFQLTGVYFAMITLGFAEIAKLLMIEHFGSETAITPQANEYLVGIPFVESLQVPLGEELLTSYYVLGVITLLAYFAMQRIIHSPFGRVMIAIRENEERARAIGYNTYWYKMIAFAISGAFAALAGALAAGFKNSGDPTIHFDVIELSGDALLATIIGGMGTLAGPLYGFIFQRALDEILGGTIGLVGWIENTFPGLVETTIALGVSVQDVLNNSVQGFAGFYVGIVFILFILYVPGGMLGTARAAMGGTLAATFPGWVRRRFESVWDLVRSDTED